MWRKRPKAKRGRRPSGKGATRYIPLHLLDVVDRLLNS